MFFSTPVLADPYVYTQDEGKFVLRANIGAALPDYSIESTNIQTTKDPTANSSFIGDIGASYFITDHFSFGASLGYKSHSSNTQIFSAFGTTVGTDSGHTTELPLTGLIEFYPAPYGALRPYIGGGFAHDFVLSSFSNIDYSSPSGPVINGGVDWWYDKTFGLNFDVRKYFYSITADYTKEYSSLGLNTPVKQKFNDSPIELTAGVAIRFK